MFSLGHQGGGMGAVPFASAQGDASERSEIAGDAGVGDVAVKQASPFA